MRVNSQTKRPRWHNPYNRNRRWAGLTAALVKLAIGLLVLSTPINLLGQTDQPRRAVPTPNIQNLASSDLATRNEAERRAIDYLAASGKQIDEWLSEQPASPLHRTAEFQHRLARIRILVAEARQKQMLQPTTLELGNVKTGKQLLAQLNQLTTAVEWDGSDEDLQALVLPNFQNQAASDFWSVLEQVRQLNEIWIEPCETTLRISKTSTHWSDKATYSVTGHRGLVWAGLSVPDVERGAVQQVRLNLLWDPKLKVVSVEFPMAELEIRNETGSDWGQFNPQATTYGTRERQPGSRARFPVKKYEASKSIESISLPFRLVVFTEPTVAKFPNILDQATRPKRHQAGMATIEVTRRDQQTNSLRVQIRTKYDATKMARALRSHNTWSQYCEAALVGPDGVKLLAKSQQQVKQTEFEHVMEYDFDLQANEIKAGNRPLWALEFRAPSGMIEVKDTITLRQGSQ